MAEQLLTTTIQAPGFMGLNRQDSSVGLDNGFATIADNCVIDKFGRIGARKGWTPVHSTLAAMDATPVRMISEVINNTGSSYIVVATNNKLFKLVGTTMTELTYSGGGTAPTITDSNWQAAALAGVMYLYQTGHDPLLFDPGTSATTYIRIAEKSGHSGTVQNANCAISAYGRIWSANTSADVDTIQFSDILDGAKLSGGTSGTLDVSTVWPAGQDEIMALAAHNNFLYVFGRRQILIYSGANVPATMTLYDSVSGVGCYARDSVVVTGKDVIFLSDSGIKSLERVVQEKSPPMRDLSSNVRDDVVASVSVENAKYIKAIYSDVNAFYLLSLPVSNIVYCLDMRMQLQTGASRVTTWSSIKPTAFCSTRDKRLLLGQVGYVGEYKTNLDNAATYRLQYYTNYFDLGSPTSLKILKKINMTFIGGNGANAVVKYGFDYSSQFNSRNIILGEVSIAEYGIAEYNIGQYTAGVVFDNKKIQASGSGNTLQLGLETVVNGFEISLQKLDCYVKVGRTR